MRVEVVHRAVRRVEEASGVHHLESPGTAWRGGNFREGPLCHLRFTLSTLSANVAGDLDEHWGGKFGAELHNPDFVRLAEAYGVVGRRLSDRCEDLRHPTRSLPRRSRCVVTLAIFLSSVPP